MIRLRQVVLVAADLKDAVADVRSKLGLLPGVVHDMSHLHLEHEVLTVGDTFLEIVSPVDLDGDDAAARALQRGGDGGYMVVLQVSDADAAVRRAEQRGVRVVHSGELNGARFVQYHPKDAGTLLETDQVEPWESWHFAPEIFERRCDDVTSGIEAVTIATSNPAEVARRWAAVGGLDEPSGEVLELDEGTVKFVDAFDGPSGLVAIDVRISDRSRVGDVISCCGVPVTFV